MASTAGVILKYCPCGGDLLLDDTTNTLYCEKAHLGGNHYRESVLGGVLG